MMSLPRLGYKEPGHSMLCILCCSFWRIPDAPQGDPCGQEQRSVANSQQGQEVASNLVSQLGSGSSLSPNLK